MLWAGWYLCASKVRTWIKSCLRESPCIFAVCFSFLKLYVHSDKADPEQSSSPDLPALQFAVPSQVSRLATSRSFWHCSNVDVKGHWRWCVWLWNLSVWNSCPKPSLLCSWYPCTYVQVLSPLVQMAGGGALLLFSKSQLIQVLSSGLYEKFPFDSICILDKSCLTFGISCAMWLLVPSSSLTLQMHLSTRVSYMVQPYETTA